MNITLTYKNKRIKGNKMNKTKQMLNKADKLEQKNEIDLNVFT